MENRVQPWKKWYTPMSELANNAALTVLPVFLAGNRSTAYESGKGQEQSGNGSGGGAGKSGSGSGGTQGGGGQGGGGSDGGSKDSVSGPEKGGINVTNEK